MIAVEFKFESLNSYTSYLHLTTPNIQDIERLSNTLSEIVYDFDEYDMVQTNTNLVSVFIPKPVENVRNDVEEFLSLAKEVFYEINDEEVVFLESSFDVQKPVVTILYSNNIMPKRVYLLNAQQKKFNLDTSINYVAYTALNSKNIPIYFDINGNAYIEIFNDSLNSVFENDCNVLFIENNAIFK